MLTQKINATKVSHKTSKLMEYHWRGKDLLGEKTKGSLLAFSLEEAQLHLKEQQINIAKIKIRTPSTWTIRKNRANSEDVTLFTHQIAVMLEAGVPLNDTLTLLKNSTNKAELKQLFHTLISQIEAGSSLSQALGDSSPLIDSFYCSLVSTGEQTGNLHGAFKRIATYRQKSEALKSKVKKAMIYPVIVVLCAMLVSIGMLVFVIPTFADIFNTFNAELPWLTEGLLNISDFVVTNGAYITLSTVLLCFIAAKVYKKNDRLHLKAHQLALRTPIFGELFVKGNVASFSQTLSATFSAGIPLLDGIYAAEKSTRNRYFQTCIQYIHQQTASGHTLYVAARETKIFPEMALQMLLVGEETGSLDEMLSKVANIYETEVADTVDNLGNILEPLIIIFLGGLIGTLIVAMYLPMFNLMNVLT